MTPSEDRNRLAAVTLDEASLGRGNADQEHERRTSVFDLVEDNSFALPGHDRGPYHLHLAQQEGRLVFNVTSQAGEPVIVHILSLQPLRSVLRDYLMLCDHYYSAIRSATPSQIEAIDMGRRGLHDEGAERLGQRLKGKIECDRSTLRRLFTLVTALHWKG